jgi:hypothetical protein
MPELSPAAQAVLDAAYRRMDENPHNEVVATLAAALRAAVEQVMPEVVNAVGDKHDDARHDQWVRIRCRFLAIAAELEAQ